eukprot:1681958-Rhodomonas_salina.1
MPRDFPLLFSPSGTLGMPSRRSPFFHARSPVLHACFWPFLSKSVTNSSSTSAFVSAFRSLRSLSPGEPTASPSLHHTPPSGPPSILHFFKPQAAAYWNTSVTQPESSLRLGQACTPARPFGTRARLRGERSSCPPST